MNGRFPFGVAGSFRRDPKYDSIEELVMIKLNNRVVAEQKRQQRDG